MEMDVVLRVLLERTELLSTDEPDEPWVIRGIVLAAGKGGRAAVRRRPQNHALVDQTRVRVDHVC
jgi:cytochrome P450